MKLLLLMVLLMVLMVQTAAQQTGLFPAILNLASNALISSNATCGDPEPEVYCKLVEHVPGRRIKNPHCPKCDANSALSKERHPIGNAIDGTNQWWQSPSIKNGRQFHWITVTLDLKQIFQVAYIIIKAANSPRPGNWVLERSVDGVTFDPWQFYAISDSECLSRFNVTPRLGPPTYKRDTEVICTSYYSRLNPLEHGEIHTSLINGRPGADDLTSDLLNFTSARYIRLRLQRIRTLNADLMTLSTRDPRDIDPIVTRRYYYSIKDVSVGGMCICHGHARSCPLDPETQKLQCVCEHNTCGESCSECCPGYHQKPWQPGTVSEGNTCEKCNCHNKAVHCFYNQTVSELFWSLNHHGVRQGGGVCIDCQQNTAGVNCESCKAGYYRPAEVSPYAESPCVDCSCDSRGSKSSVCVRDDSQHGVPPGQCQCLLGFFGLRCDRCAFGFTKFPECFRCDCNEAGSTNTDPCSPCTCKANVMGAHCDLCKPGFYNLQRSNPLGCTDCFCFGVSDVCESSTWSKIQVSHLEAWLRPPQHRGDSGVVNNLPEGRHLSSSHMLQWAAPQRFLGNKLLSYGGFLNFSVLYDVPSHIGGHSLPVYCDIIMEGNSQTLRLLPPLLLFLSPLAKQSVSMTMVPEVFTDGQTGNVVVRDDLLLVLAAVTSLTVRVHLNASADGPIRLSSFSLDMADPDSALAPPSVTVETCECPWGYSGTSCESCLPGFYRVGGVLFGGNCLQCECNDHSTECDVNGECVDCAHNTTGPHCVQCLPGFYGDPSAGTPSDCLVCPCPLTVSSNRFSPTCVLHASGQLSCDQCEDGYTGSTCERCATGFYGNPQVVGGACARCQCHGNVDVSDPAHCDTDTGECVRCRGNTAGRHCELCEPGYYGDAVLTKQCRKCSCDVSGALTSECDVTTGQCVCRANVGGRTCDRCQSGFFGPLSKDGCQPCGCSPSGSLSESCDEEGRCQCVRGLAGDKCDRCSRGYYGFHGNGCSECTCGHTGGNCDPESGECVCPPHTEGDTCDRCNTGFWGHDPMTGCKPCNCTSAGSSAPQCHRTNGQCLCKDGFSGRSCDCCAPGYYGYPACTACGCDVAGTNETFCSVTLGVCTCLHTGECVCKAGVSGRRCEECVAGGFSLSVLNPSGCSSCFCSGVSAACEEQAGLSRVHITLAHPPAGLAVVTQSNLHQVSSGVHQQGGDALLDTRRLNATRLAGPLYWRLPPQFTGPQLLSYGGVLSYIVTFHAEDGSGLSNQEPQVLIGGGTLRTHVIYTDMVAPGNGVRTQHDISLTEHRWRYFNSVWAEPVTRDDFMSVLSNVQLVLVKASYGGRLQLSRISNITMETAADLGEESPFRGGVAKMIESCVCPPGYSGLSCQDCSPGFFRQPPSELASGALKSMFVRPCVRCRCNNHSRSCDAQTGECEDCQHNTSGRSCEVCAVGYYGNISGSISDCSLCACPLQDNSFSPSCEALGPSGDFRCTSCQRGSEGRYCERCSPGYYGNPAVVGGACFPCNCSLWGSIQPLCDPHSRQCECKAGVKGHTCDQCEDRHVAQGEECVSCDDDCSGLLLDDVDKLRHLLVSLSPTDRLVAPYRQMEQLEGRTRDAQGAPSQHSSAVFRLSRLEDELHHVTSDLQAFLHQIQRFHDAFLETEASANRSISQGALLLQRTNSLQDNIEELLRGAEHLNQAPVKQLQSANETLVLEEINAMLERIRGVNLTAAVTSSLQERSLSESLICLLREDFLSRGAELQDRLRPLRASLTAATDTLQQADRRLREAATHNKDTHTMLHNFHTLLHRHQSLHLSLGVVRLSADGNMEDSQLLLQDVVTLTEDLTTCRTEVELLASQLEQWRPLLRRQVDGLVVGLKRTDALDKVYQAESHAHSLEGHAHSLEGHAHSTFSSVSALRDASRRSGPARPDSDITGRIDSAQRAAAAALGSASSAFTLLSQSEGGGAKLDAVVDVSAESRSLGDSAEDTRQRVSMVTSRLRLVRESVHNSSVSLRRPIRELQLGSTGSSGPLHQAHQQAAAAHSSLQEALWRLHAFQLQLQDSSSVVQNSSSSVQDTNRLLLQSHSTANEVQQRLEEAELRTQRLMGRIQPLGMLGERLSRNLSDIRELIGQARRQAASIRVAMAADRSCVRSYRATVESTHFNTLSLTVKTTSRDSLLFYLGSNSTVDFLAVEVHDGKVSLLWDLGSGGARLDFHGLTVNNNRWTRINTTRFGAVGTLSVHQPDSGPDLLPAVTATSPGNTRVLNIDRNTVIHMGGLGAHTQGPAALSSSSFQGCLGHASLNERNIGLWNYERQEGQCGGCFSSPQPEETSFHFDGSGFSLVQKSLRATSTSIVLLFKTLSPGGLLLHLSSNNTRDYLSMELVEGQVRLTFDLGSGALILRSNRKYNTGLWFKITLQRNKRKGYLSIMAADQSSEKEVLEGESPGTASDLNRSDLDPIYIGGLPASRPIRRKVVSRSYVGCIKNVEIARSNFDLLRDAYGVGKGCVLKAVRSVSVLAGGFVQIAPPSLSQEAELLFSFSSNNQSGVLLAVFSDDRPHFLSVHLLSGAVEAELGEVGGATRRVTVTKRDGGSFGDGRKHSVIVHLHRKSLSVQVDERQVKSVSLFSGGFSRLSPASFFIGGLPPNKASQLPIRSHHLTTTFRGCIQHLVLGGALADLSEAVRFEGVEFDVCLLEEPSDGVVLTTDPDMEPTPDPAHLPVAPPTGLSALTPGARTCSSQVEPSFLQSAAQFGLSAHSHLTFIIDPNTVRRSTSVQVSFRSRTQDGMILLLSDSRQMDFVLLRLRGGRLLLSADRGRGPASVTSTLPVNDGEWHLVSAQVSRRSVSLSVDAAAPNAVSVKGNQLDVGSTLYLGGLPSTISTRRINASSSLSGCVRSVTLNGAMLDLSTPTSKYDVTSCFSKDQTGSYFNGSGYAELIHNGYRVGSDMSVSLEFRTNQSEGVLLGISSAKVDAIGLELTDGQVVFHVNNGAGRVSVRSIGPILCDGRWHHLLARKTKHNMSLSVDGWSSTTSNPHPQSTSAETNNPVYLGGFPVGVKQNCLSINSRFRGCLKNLQLLKSHLTNVLDLSSAHFSWGVTPNSCPVAQ